MMKSPHAADARLTILLAALLATHVAADPARAVKRRAFVTSIAGTGNISSWPGATGATTLERADSICRTLAQNASPAPLPNANTYRAWISTTSTDAYCHVRGQGGKKADGCVGGAPVAAGPWYFSNGATNWSGTLDELVDEGELYRPLSRDENFDDLPTDFAGRMAWTGTNRDGTANPTRCGDWALTTGSGLVGDSRATAARWTESNGRGCGDTARLICVEPGLSDVATLAWSPAAIVFVTSATGTGDLSSWREAGGATGIQAGDAICRQLALDARLPEPDSFVAWLSTSAVDAVDRIDTNGPFKRLDAFTVAGNLADLVDGSVDTSIHVDENGAYLTASASVLTGTLGSGEWSGLSCGDWDLTGSNEATAGGASFAGMPDWTDNWESGCSAFQRLYCVGNVVTLFWDGFDMTGDASRWSDVVE